MVDPVLDGCTEVVCDKGMYIFKMSSMPTGKTPVNFINELLIEYKEAQEPVVPEAPAVIEGSNGTW